MDAATRLAGERPGRLMDCSIAESLPKRSAVVTRRSEPAMTRVLAGFGKFSTSDAALNACFRPDEKEPSCIQSDACALTQDNPCTKLQGLSIDAGRYF